MSEERFARLETMLAYQEDTIQKLNDVIYAQQMQIDRLEEKVAVLIENLRNSGENIKDADDETPPPHY